jgi:hypothetical protein
MPFIFQRFYGLLCFVIQCSHKCSQLLAMHFVLQLLTLYFVLRLLAFTCFVFCKTIANFVGRLIFLPVRGIVGRFRRAFSSGHFVGRFVEYKVVVIPVLGREVIAWS